MVIPYVTLHSTVYLQLGYSYWVLFSHTDGWNIASGSGRYATAHYKGLYDILSLEGGTARPDVRGCEVDTTVRLRLNGVECDLKAPTGEEKDLVVFCIHFGVLLDVL